LLPFRKQSSTNFLGKIVYSASVRQRNLLCALFPYCSIYQSDSDLCPVR
jgi:hypothetical protein